MELKIKDKFSQVSNDSGRSYIREILKLLVDPELISFAGGLPSPASFPIKDITKICNKILTENGEVVLQYSTTEGDIGLREQLSSYLNKQGFCSTKDNFLITNGSQQAVDIISKLFLNKGDKIIVGLPSYLGALNVFKSYYSNTIGVKFDDKGMRTDKLEETLKKIYDKGKVVKFIYLIPDFQNPTGLTMPTTRREAILKIAQKYNCLILEDSPYREIRFSGVQKPTFYSMSPNNNVINLGTFSKILAPGLRLGWIVANETIVKRSVSLKQTMDLCTSILLQKITEEYLKNGYFEKNIPIITSIYKKKLQTMLSCFETYMPKEVSWVVPEGGLFLFLTLPKDFDASEILKTCIQKYKIAFVPGTVFYCNGKGKNQIRINFSFPSIEQIKMGIKNLANAIKEKI